MKKIIGILVIFAFILSLTSAAFAEKAIEKDDQAAADKPAVKKKEIKTAPRSDARAYYDRGYDFFKKKQFGEALKCFNAAIDMNKAYVKAYTFRGFTHFLLENYGQALSDLNKAIEMNPDNATALFYRGQAYFYLGHSKKAIQDYDRVLAKQPENSTVLIMRAIACYRLGDSNGAIKAASNTISYAPKAAEAYLLRGITYLKKKSYDSALKDFAWAVEMRPDIVIYNVINYIGQARSGKDVTSDMKAYYDKVKEKGWPAQALGLILGEITPKDFKDMAMETAKTKRDKSIREDQAYFFIAQYYFLKNNDTEAEEYLAKAQGDKGPFFLIQGLIKEDLEQMRGK
ncbi:MAG: tetratricopeptide repeat protein [Candidatus Eremiobacteraeota bacterium]|nr:tetratricopeptide repeat protein [Candidatus Eremiobacteraeota bacterium]